MTGAWRRARIVADDLTGANDTGVQFAEAGWATTLQRRPAPERVAGRGDVAIAVTTDSRAVVDATAREATSAACAQGDTSEVELTYLKIDSTMRGSVAAQVHGALEARRRERADAFVVLCPAYPAMGRTVVDGQVLVGGEPVTDSPAGSDPVTPVRHAGLTTLVPGAVAVPVAPDADAWRTALTEAARGADVVAVDARTDADLDLLARVLAGLGDRVVAAGSAGLAGPLARHWRSSTGGATARPSRRTGGRALVVVSSHHRVARDQAHRLGARPDVGVVVTTSAALESGDVPATPSDDWVVLLSPEQRTTHESAHVARAMAHWAAAWVRTAPARFDSLVLVGGDGAEAVLTALDADGIALHGRLLEGVPDGTLVGGAADGVRIVTKAGGFGDPDTLLDLHTRMTDDRTDLMETSR